MLSRRQRVPRVCRVAGTERRTLAALECPRTLETSLNTVREGKKGHGVAAPCPGEWTGRRIGVTGQQVEH